jgi:putative ABC transport system permease protein
MVLRNLERRPLRSLATIVGVALAVALLASGQFPYDSFDRLMDVEFRQAQRYGALVAFSRERPGGVARELEQVDGVLGVELFRSTSVRITRGATSRTTAITGLESGSTLYRLVDESGRAYRPPDAGCVMTVGLARVLGVETGDTITVELLERGSDERSLVVAGLFDPMLSQGLFMSRTALNRLLDEHDRASGAYLSLVPGVETRVLAQLKELPGIAAATSRATTINDIDEQIRQSMVFVLTLIIVSAGLIAIGVVYNSARIALSERGRELASLRVLGFTTNEVAGLLLGEQFVVLLVALPVGIGIGAAFAFALARGFESERFHFPYVFAFHTQVFAATVVTAAALLAGVVVRQRIGRLDMVAALRTRE